MRSLFRVSLVARGPVFAIPLKQQKIDEVVRVDHAGEVAAVRIAKHQLQWMSPLDDAVPIAQEILADEIIHERVMTELAERHGVRTTSLDPFFKLGAFVMGAGTACLGKEAMMCCHAAVEITIFDHYNDQLRELECLEDQCANIQESGEEKEAWKDVKNYIVKFRDEEKHHQELGEQNGAEKAPAYPLLYNGIRAACKIGVALAKLPLKKIESILSPFVQMKLSQSAAQALSKFTDELVSIERKADNEATALRLEYRGKMEPLLLERRELLKGVDGFWSGVFSSPETPIASLLNGTIDPKITRAVIDFQIITRVSADKLYRKIILTFRQNMFVEEGEVSREVDSEMKTTSLVPLKWKQGTERARTDSFFAFFTDAFSSDAEGLSETVEALDMIYQNPFLAVEAD